VKRRREARTRAFEWKKLPKIVLLAGGTIALGWLCVTNTAVDALVRSNPLLAANFSPEDPRIATTLAMREFRQKQGEVTPAIAKSAIGSLQRAPLIEEPFLLAALDSLIRGEEARAERLLIEARRRNPRAQVPRILLLDRHLRAGRMQQAASEITAIGRLVPGTTQVLVPQLAKFAKDPKTRGPLAQVIKSDPNIRRVLLDHLAANGADPEVVLGLSGPIQPLTGGVPPPEWQRLLLSSMVEKGNIKEAHLLWRRFVGASGDESEPAVYDGNFQRLPGPPPFSWELITSAAGAAEPSKASGLQVEYYGRADARLASQLLTLKPGRYRLTFRATGDTPERGSNVFWRVSCQPSTTELAAIPIANLSYAPKQIGGDFIVPATGCAGQWLRLTGTPAEFPTAHSITISNLRVQPAGAS
jgi:hypothetical protein